MNDENGRLLEAVARSRGRVAEPWVPDGGSDGCVGVGLGDNRGTELTEPIGVFVRVMTAEQQFAACGKDSAYASGGIAPIAPVGGGQLRGGQRTGHDSSKLATFDNGRLGSGPPRRG